PGGAAVRGQSGHAGRAGLDRPQDRGAAAALLRLPRPPARAVAGPAPPPPGPRAHRRQPQGHPGPDPAAGRRVRGPDRGRPHPVARPQPLFQDLGGVNIGLVCPYEWTVPGGVGNHVRALAGELRRAGHRVDVLAPAERPVPEPGFVGLGGSVAGPHNGSGGRRPFRPPPLARGRRAVRRGGYDLLHVHEPLSPSAGLLAATQAGPVPVVGTFHANLGRSLALEAASPLLRRVYDRLAGRIAVSATARDTWQGQFGGAMAVVPNGVGPEFYASPEPLEGWKADGPTLLFVGRLEPRKGLTYLGGAFLRLKPAFPRLRLLVVGRDAKRLQDKAMALVPPRLRTDLIFVGSVARADLPSFYATAAVLQI